MRMTYLVLARLIAILVVVQAMTMVLAVAGFFHWIDGGGSADPAVLKQWEDTPPDFDGSVGFMIHGLSGTMIIPIVALLLLIASFFAKVPRGVVFALVVVVSDGRAGLRGHRRTRRALRGNRPWAQRLHPVRSGARRGPSGQQGRQGSGGTGAGRVSLGCRTAR